MHTFFLFLLFFHSWMRWLLLLALLGSIFRAAAALLRRTAFSPADNALRHWTATLSHIQLTVGMVLYLQSPVAAYFRRHPGEGWQHREAFFFGLVHISIMLTAVVVLSAGSALAKRRHSDHHKFRTVLIWYAGALLLMLAAIPWPGSQLAGRSLFRGL